MLSFLYASNSAKISLIVTTSLYLFTSGCSDITLDKPTNQNNTSAGAASAGSVETLFEKLPASLSTMSLQKTGEITGCIQGVVADAIKGGRVDLSAAGTSIYATIRGTIVKASILSDNTLLSAEEKSKVMGEYYLCNIPVTNVGTDNKFPVYYVIPGYQEYYQISAAMPTPDTYVYNTTVSNTTNATNNSVNNSSNNSSTNTVTLEDSRMKSSPTLLQDVSIYKISDLLNNPYTVLVTYAGKPLANTFVRLLPTGTSASSSSIRMTPLTATTDATGTVTFEAAKLAFGADYKLQIIPQNIKTSGTTISPSYAEYDLTIGQTKVTVASEVIITDMFSAQINLSTYTGNDLTIVSISETQTVVDSGKMELVFNRDVEFNTAQNHLATAFALADIVGTKVDGSACSAGGVIVTAANDDKYTVTVDATNARKVTITPKFATVPTFTDCNGGYGYQYAAANIGTLKIRAKDAGNSEEEWINLSAVTHFAAKTIYINRN